MTHNLHLVSLETISWGVEDGKQPGIIFMRALVKSGTFEMYRVHTKLCWTKLKLVLLWVMCSCKRMELVVREVYRAFKPYVGSSAGSCHDKVFHLITILLRHCCSNPTSLPCIQN